MFHYLVILIASFYLAANVYFLFVDYELFFAVVIRYLLNVVYIFYTNTFADGLRTCIYVTEPLLCHVVVCVYFAGVSDL